MEYIYPNELQHHGILGMKWGVRRYQNKDGTLTRAGKLRAKKLVSDRDSEYFKYYINKLNQDNYKREAYNGIVYDDDDKKLINEEIQVINKLRDKFLNGHLDDKLVVAYTDNFDHKWSEGRPDYLKIDDINKIEEYGIRDRKAAESAPKPDIIKSDSYKSLQSGLEKEKNTIMPSDQEWNEKMRTDAAFRKTWNDTAALGLKALNKTQPGLDMDPSNSGNKEWFVFEDQTIGMPDVAYLINKGYKADNVKNMISQARDLDYDTAHNQNNTRFMASFIFGAREGYGLEEFADEAQKIYDQEHKKK